MKHRLIYCRPSRALSCPSSITDARSRSQSDLLVGDWRGSDAGPVKQNDTRTGACSETVGTAREHYITGLLRRCDLNLQPVFLLLLLVVAVVVSVWQCVEN